MKTYLKSRTPIVIVSLILAILVPQTTYAHGFGARYDLPVPLWLYITGGGATVTLSFLVIGLFVGRSHSDLTYRRINLLSTPILKNLFNRYLILELKIVSVLLFLITIVSGLAGSQEASSNLVPTMIWVIWWVGLAYFSALVGNIWALINPWKIIYGWAEGLYFRVMGRSPLSMNLPYPEEWGVWPGVILFIIFSWIELVFPGSADPSSIAILVLFYSATTWFGMFLFGKDVWLSHGEAFSIAFGYLAKFAPTDVRITEPEVCQNCPVDCQDLSGECIDCYPCFSKAQGNFRQLNLRMHGTGLLRNEEVSPSSMAFVIILLSTVTFDGFTATPLWADIVNTIYGGFINMTVIGTLGLTIFPVLFISVYLVFSWLMTISSGNTLSVGEMASKFVYSLIPISLAYHLAHYLTFIVIQGQLIIPLASDPLGIGWNILGTAGYDVNISLVGARFAWFSAVTAIVIGHIIAVYIAHMVALRALKDRNAVIRSQIPMLILMVGYTMLSLWILAQPIVEID